MLFVLLSLPVVTPSTVSFQIPINTKASGRLRRRIRESHIPPILALLLCWVPVNFKINYKTLLVNFLAPSGLHLVIIFAKVLTPYEPECMVNAQKNPAAAGFILGQILTNSGRKYIYLQLICFQLFHLLSIILIFHSSLFLGGF